MFTLRRWRGKLRLLYLVLNFKYIAFKHRKNSVKIRYKRKTGGIMREYYDLRDVKKTKATVYVLPQVSHFLREGDLIEIDIKGDLWLAVMLDSQRLILTRKL